MSEGEDVAEPSGEVVTTSTTGTGRLVIFYSFEGHTKAISEGIAEAVNADTLEIVCEEDLGTHGFMKYMWGGKQVLMREQPTLKEFQRDPKTYDVIFIGTPVWAYTFTPALRTFFSMKLLEGKKIVVFCSHRGGPGGTLRKMKAELEGNEIISEKDFKEVKKDNNSGTIEVAAEWAKEIVKDL